MLEAILVADISSYISPITTTYSVIEKIVSKEPPKAPLEIPKNKKEMFDMWAKEDFYKNDPYADMWNENWISNGYNMQIMQVNPLIFNKPPIKKKIKHTKHKAKKK